MLDLGCGQGIDLARYAAAGATVAGIDLTPCHVELARAHLAAQELPGTVVLGDADRLQFADRSFDRVASNGVLHHTPGIAAALHEIRRVLPPAEHRRQARWCGSNRRDRLDGCCGGLLGRDQSRRCAIRASCGTSGGWPRGT